jgi:hypothetical protein
MKTEYTIIYTSANNGTSSYARKTLKGAVALCSKLMERDNAVSVQLVATHFDAEGTQTEIFDWELAELDIVVGNIVQA